MFTSWKPEEDWGIATSLYRWRNDLDISLSKKIGVLENSIDTLARATAAGFADVDRRFDEVIAENNARFDKIEHRIDRMGEQFDTLDAKITTNETVQNRRLDTVEDKMHVVYAK